MLTLSPTQQRAVDHEAATAWHLPEAVLMARAGACVAREVMRVIRGFAGEPSDGAHGTAPSRATTGAFGTAVILAGGGNNGGDGWVAARFLADEGVPVVVVTEAGTAPDATRRDAAAEARRAAEICGVEVLEMEASGTAASEGEGAADLWRDRLRRHLAPYCPATTVVVDALCGTGFDPARGLSPFLREAFAAVAWLREEGATILAVDIPSGIDAASGEGVPEAVRAHRTVTFLAPKQGMVTGDGLSHAGEAVVCGLGIPEILWKETARRTAVDEGQPLVTQTNGAELRTWIPRRASDSHKGNHGRVVILAGSEATPGAAVLAVMAAMRSGAGLVYAAANDPVISALLVREPAAVLRRLPDVPEGSDDGLDAAVRAWVAGADAVVLGPGSGVHEGTVRRVAALLAGARRLILDADALNVLAKHPEMLEEGARLRREQGLDPVVLTPHPGEFARLFPALADAPRLVAAREAALKSHAYIVLKGAGTVIASPDPDAPVRVNDSGSSALARGGSGDLLAGLMGSLAARDIPLDRAIAIAVHLHGAAAEEATARHAGNLTAHHHTHWLEALPAAMTALGFD